MQLTTPEALSETPTTTPASWPTLPALTAWLPTLETVHRWTQIIGKIRIARSVPLNHTWHSALYVTPQGLTTSPLYVGARAFTIDLDFLDHRLHVQATSGDRRSFALAPMPVSEFYARLMRALRELDVETRIWPVAVEIPGPPEFLDRDRDHASYDRDAMSTFFRALVQVHRVFSTFRAGFLGKSSPVHFFWGSFDLAVTRFSGRTAPKHPGGAPNCADWVMQDAYSHEVSSAGFWPGPGFGEAAFYAYAYPEPKGYAERRVAPSAAYYHAEMHEYVLPYEAVRTSDDPDAAVMAFLESTYAAAADLANWDRAALERA